jgi:hypothetical protein
MASGQIETEGARPMACRKVCNCLEKAHVVELIPSLLHDYEPLSMPTRLRYLARHHRSNVKCVAHLQRDSGLGVSGSRSVDHCRGGLLRFPDIQ